MNNREPNASFREDLAAKSEIHELRCSEICEDDIEVLTLEKFQQTIEFIRMKPGSKYEFIVNAGNSLHGALFKLCHTVWKNEQIPDKWHKSRLVQVYKGKGDRTNLDNMRHLHIKDDIPKLFGHLVMSEAKEILTSNMSKFQIGAKPGHRAQEHLYVIKSVILSQTNLGIPVFLTMWDVSKFFDRECLRDCMNEVYRNKVKGKLYRLIFNMNKATRIAVQTPVGLTDEFNTGESVGQGTLEGAIISAVNLDNGVCDFFGNSTDEMGYFGLRLGPLLFQDDVARLAADIHSVQSANIRMEALSESKLLDFNLKKSCFMVFSNSSCKKKMEADLARTPVTLCSKPMNRVVEAKYLGDWLSSVGLDESVALTIQKRKWQVVVAIQDIRRIVDDARSKICGGITAGLEIWELAIIPMLLYNAESWLGISPKTISMIEDLQKQFLRVLLGAATGTPIPALYWETGTLLIKYRILFRKLMFLHHLETLPKDSLAYEVFQVQKSLNLPGLLDDCKEILCNLNLSNIQEYSKEQWKRVVKNEILSKNKEYMVKESKTFKKIAYKNEDEFLRQNYLADMTVMDARLMY